MLAEVGKWSAYRRGRRVCFVNTDTHSCQWEPPTADLMQHVERPLWCCAEWNVRLDIPSGAAYFEHSSTGEKTWTPPPPVLAAVGSQAPLHFVTIGSWSWMVDVATWRGYFVHLRGSGRTRCRMPPRWLRALSERGWQQCTDPVSGVLYYFRARTGESQWHLPLSDLVVHCAQDKARRMGGAARTRQPSAIMGSTHEAASHGPTLCIAQFGSSAEQGAGWPVQGSDSDIGWFSAVDSLEGRQRRIHALPSGSVDRSTDRIEGGVRPGDDLGWGSSTSSTASGAAGRRECGAQPAALRQILSLPPVQSTGTRRLPQGGESNGLPAAYCARPQQVLPLLRRGPSQQRL